MCWPVYIEDLTRVLILLLNLLKELGERDKMRGLPSILSLFHNEFNKFTAFGNSIFFNWKLLSDNRHVYLHDSK